MKLIDNHWVVFDGGVLVGELSYKEGAYQFVYSPTYKGKAFDGLAKNMLHSSIELFPLFENLIPEYERREKLLFGKEILAEVLPQLSNSHGSLDFVAKDKLFQYQNNEQQRPSWLSVKQDILGENEFPNILDLTIEINDDILNDTSNTEHSNLSGYQTKIDVNVDWKSKRVFEAESATYLLKPRNLEHNDYFGRDKNNQKQYYPFIALNEHLFMSFAKNELSFDVPYTGVIKAERDFHYLVKRYDRYKGFKYEQKDFAQLLLTLSRNKYKSGSEILFQKIDEVLSSETSKIEALRFYFYSYLIKHADLHLKNIGAMSIGKNRYALTPLYDVISVALYKGDCDDLALPFLKPYKKPRNWKMDDFYRLGQILGLNKLAIKKALLGVAKTYITRMPEYIKRVKELEKEHDLQMQKSRKGKMLFSKKLENIYNEKLISLRKLGILSELGLIEEV
jgi:serine/threonine-protein kinase HipA